MVHLSVGDGSVGHIHHKLSALSRGTGLNSGNLKEPLRTKLGGGGTKNIKTIEEDRSTR